MTRGGGGALGWLQFGLWTLAGAGVAVGILGMLTVGIVVLPAAAALTALLAWRGDRRMAGPGLLAGSGMVPMYVGYLNRGGPGMACTTTAVSGACTQEVSPWPWLAAGLLLVTAGVALLLRRRARSRYW